MKSVWVITHEFHRHMLVICFKPTFILIETMKPNLWSSLFDLRQQYQNIIGSMYLIFMCITRYMILIKKNVLYAKNVWCKQEKICNHTNTFLKYLALNFIRLLSFELQKIRCYNLKYRINERVSWKIKLLEITECLSNE